MPPVTHIHIFPLLNFYQRRNTMSFGDFPWEILSLAFKYLGDDAHLDQFDKTTQKVIGSNALKALRLTSKRYCQIATKELFQHFHDKSDLKSWERFLFLVKQPFLVRNIRHLTLEDCRYEGKRDIDHVRRRFHPFSRPDFMHDLSVFPHLESIQTKEWFIVNARKVRNLAGQLLFALVEMVQLFETLPLSQPPSIGLRVSDLDSELGKTYHDKGPVQYSQ